jgi:hypothetical protein
VQRIRDILDDTLPTAEALDRTLASAKRKYEEEVQHVLKALEATGSQLTPEFERVKAESLAMEQYVKRLGSFHKNSVEYRKLLNTINLLYRILSDAERQAQLDSGNVVTKEWKYNNVTRDELNKDHLNSYWKKANEDERKAHTTYTDYDAYDSMNAMLRQNDIEMLREVLGRVVSGGTTQQDERDFKKYNVVDKDGTVRYDWKSLLKNCLDLQQSSRYLKTTKPMLLRRHIKKVNWLDNPRLGDRVKLEGFTSAFGTEESNCKIDGNLESVKPNTLIRVPVGTPFIPVGKRGRQANADEIILPHGLRATVVYLHQEEPLSLELEILPNQGDVYKFVEG